MPGLRARSVAASIPSRLSTPGRKLCVTTSAGSGCGSDDARPSVGLDVQRDGSLASVGGHERCGVLAPQRVAGERLDLHDVGTEVAEQRPSERASDEVTELQHPHAGQRPTVFQSDVTVSGRRG